MPKCKVTAGGHLNWRLPDWVGILSFVITCLLSLFTVLLALIKEENKTISGVMLCTITVFFIFATLALIYILRIQSRSDAETLLKVSVENERLKSTVNEIQNVVDQQRKSAEKRIRKEFASTKIFRNIAKKSVQYDDYVDDFLESPETINNTVKALEKFKITTTEKFVGPMMDEIALLFSVLSKKPCAASLKVRICDPLSDDKEEFLSLLTWARDQKSASIRLYDHNEIKGLDNYRYELNTAFKFIIDSQDTDYWGANDLDALGHEYLNKNPDRRKLYNATAVHGLRDPLSQLNDAPGINGFLCVDNKSGNLNNRLTESVLGILSYYMYNVIRKFTGVDSVLAPLIDTVPDRGTYLTLELEEDK